MAFSPSAVQQIGVESSSVPSHVDTLLFEDLIRERADLRRQISSNVRLAGLVFLGSVVGLGVLLRNVADGLLSRVTSSSIPTFVEVVFLISILLLVLGFAFHTKALQVAYEVVDRNINQQISTTHLGNSAAQVTRMTRTLTNLSFWAGTSLLVLIVIPLTVVLGDSR